MATRTVLVGGGTGFVGTRLNKLLKLNNYNVINVSRMPAANNIPWTAVENSDLPSGTSAVVNLAGQQFLDFTKSWTPGFKQNVYNSRVYTTRALATAINKSQHQPKVLVVVTGVGAYEPSETTKYDESSPTTGQDFFSKLVVDWEKAACVNPPVRLVIIRSGVVIGREGGMINNLFLPFFLGLGGPIASGKQFLPWIHIEDLIRLIQFSIECEEVKGILNGVAPHIITNEEFTKAFAQALMRPAIFPVPEFGLNFLLNEERAMLLTKGQHVTPKRTLEYGFKFKYPKIEDACAECAHLFPKN